MSALELFADVVGDAGHLVTRTSPDVVVAIVGRSESVLARLLTARQSTFPAPVVVVLPYEDGRLAQQAVRLGAAATYASGTPLQRLLDAIEAAGCSRRPTRCAISVR